METPAQKEFLDHIEHLRDYWLGKGHSNVDPNRSAEDKMNGFIFSLLVTFDGGSAALPGFDLIPAMHEDDEAEAYSPFYDGKVINDCQLHDLWSARERAKIIKK